MVSPLVLRELLTSDEAAFRRAVDAFRAADPDWEFAFRFDDREPFDAYVARVAGWARGEQLDGWVPQTNLVAVVGEEIVGRVSLRHVLNDRLRSVGGHIGYGVVPSHRRRGHATEMLRQTLARARGLGIVEALVTCDEDNLASRRTIERNGGELIDVVAMASGPGKRRYRVAT